MAKLTRVSGLRLDAVTGEYPLDAHVETVMADHRVAMLLVQMPKGGGGGPASSQGDNADRKKQNEIERLRNEVRNLKNAKPNGALKVQKGNLKNPNKQAQREPRMPAELIGMENKHNGQRICFAYNCATGCDLEVDSKRHMCKRGKHVCARKGCGQQHSAKDHTPPRITGDHWWHSQGILWDHQL